MLQSEVQSQARLQTSCISEPHCGGGEREKERSQRARSSRTPELYLVLLYQSDRVSVPFVPLRGKKDRVFLPIFETRAGLFQSRALQFLPSARHA